MSARWTEADVAAYLARQHPSAPAVAEPESRFQARVVALAKTQGYRVYHPYRSDRSAPGWPDLALARAGDKLVLAELKATGGKQSAAQRDWYEELRRIARVETYLWTPQDWEAVVAVLLRKGPL